MEGHRTGPSTPGVASPVLNKGEGSPPSTCWQYLSSTAQDNVHCLFCKGTLLAHVQLGVCQDPQGLCCNITFQLGDPLHILVHGVVPPQRQDLAPWHLSLLNFMRFLSTHFSSLLRSFWMAAQPSSASVNPPSLVSSENLLRVHSTSSSRSLVKILNRTATSIDPWVHC